MNKTENKSERNANQNQDSGRNRDRGAARDRTACKANEGQRERQRNKLKACSVAESTHSGDPTSPQRD